MNAARKAVEHGYQVYILPNPRGTRTADFIFVRKNIYKLFDLKTISGKTIVESQLFSSIGQANRDTRGTVPFVTESQRIAKEGDQRHKRV